MKVPEPAYEKTILCLANSRRPGGRCVAGKEFVNERARGWIRPVNVENGHAISEADQQYENGTSADVLDIVTIPFKEARPQAYQTENHLINSDYYWLRQGRADWNTVVAATDNVQGPLWRDDDSSYHGINDKILEPLANQLTRSLYLIAPANLRLWVGKESQYGGGSKRKVRALFQLNGTPYSFVVTDPWIETQYFAQADGLYPIKTARLCVSLAEAYAGISTKLVATVITPERAA